MRRGRGRAVVASWRRMVETGTAGDRCDEIVRDHHAAAGVPDRLIAALAGAQLVPETQISATTRRHG